MKKDEHDYKGLERAASDVLEHHYMMMNRVMHSYAMEVAYHSRAQEELEKVEGMYEAAVDSQNLCARCGEHISKEEAWIQGEE